MTDTTTLAPVLAEYIAAVNAFDEEAIAAIWSSAHAGDVSARLANACSRGHTTTAARWYQRPSVLPQFPM